MKVRNDKIQRILIIILIINLLVAAAKLVVGLISGSNAMVADGVHSSLDGMSNIVGIVGIALAARPADEDHPYGHRRFETLASMVIGAMLMFTAIQLVAAGIERLREGSIANISLINFVTMIVTLLINIAVSTYERVQGEKLNSELLIADAAHTKSDFYVSAVVIIGLVGVKIGFPWADPVASLFVVVLIGITAFQVLRQAASILVDKATVPEREIISSLEGELPIENIHGVRSRGPEDEFFIDLTISTPSILTALELNKLSNSIEQRLKNQFPGCKAVNIQYLPEKGRKDLSFMVREQAGLLSLGIHDLTLAPEVNGLVLELHVELSGDQTVGEADGRVKVFEENLLEAIPGINRIITHIEPFTERSTEVSMDLAITDLERQLANLMAEHFPGRKTHDFMLRESGEGIFSLSMHTQFPATMLVNEAHEIVEKIEVLIRGALPMIDRITIHSEPINPDA